MSLHSPSSQADGYADSLTRIDVALAACGLVAMAQQVGLSQLCLLHLIAGVWDEMAEAPTAQALVQAAADSITS